MYSRRQRCVITAELKCEIPGVALKAEGLWPADVTTCECRTWPLVDRRLGWSDGPTEANREDVSGYVPLPGHVPPFTTLQHTLVTRKSVTTYFVVIAYITLQRN